jgi:plastocyanin
MTIFIPCGTTLAMEALAISSANPFLGASILAAFILGTSPLFFGVGWLTSVLGDNFRATFLRVAALVVLYLGVTSINGALVASGSPISLQAISAMFQAGSLSGETVKLYNEAQPSNAVQINVTAYGYSPNYIKVKKGSSVTLTLVSKDAYSCASAFRIPTLGISKNLQANETYKISFTPTQIGKIPFTCSMGMYNGVIEVI